MEKWELALNKFLEEYLNEDYFLGAILTGSYATGNNDVNSDIDVFIVTKDSTTWRERGNRLIDGYMIEYFINPVRQVLKEFDDGFKDSGIATTLIFAGSKILYDRDGTIEKLVNRAKEKFKKVVELTKKIDVQITDLKVKYDNAKKIIDYFYDEPYMSRKKYQKHYKCQNLLLMV